MLLLHFIYKFDIYITVPSLLCLDKIIEWTNSQLSSQRTTQKQLEEKIFKKIAHKSIRWTNHLITRQTPSIWVGLARINHCLVNLNIVNPTVQLPISRVLIKLAANYFMLVSSIMILTCVSVKPVPAEDIYVNSKMWNLTLAKAVFTKWVMIRRILFQTILIGLDNMINSMVLILIWILIIRNTMMERKVILTKDPFLKIY